MEAFNDTRPFRTRSFIGEKHIVQHDTPPRLVWIPSADSFGPPVQVGANPKTYATRVAGVDCAVWGEDLKKTEDMANDLIVALHCVLRCRGNYELLAASIARGSPANRVDGVVDLSLTTPAADVALGVTETILRESDYPNAFIEIVNGNGRTLGLPSMVLGAAQGARGRRKRLGLPRGLSSRSLPSQHRRPTRLRRDRAQAGGRMRESAMLVRPIAQSEGPA